MNKEKKKTIFLETLTTILALIYSKMMVSNCMYFFLIYCSADDKQGSNITFVDKGKIPKKMKDIKNMLDKLDASYPERAGEF